ncbi:hypothetical protein PFISCL1PPCAC_26793, partial [Pristionchus fissidentatus]
QISFNVIEMSCKLVVALLFCFVGAASARFWRDEKLAMMEESQLEDDCPRIHRVVDLEKTPHPSFLPPSANIIAPLKFESGACPPGCKPKEIDGLQVIYVVGEKVFIENIPLIVTGCVRV